MNSLTSPNLKRASATCVALVSMLAVAAPPSEAATVTGSSHYTQGPPKGDTQDLHYRSIFTAAPGEDNHLTVRHGNGPDIFTEAALPVTAHGLCVQLTPSSASCPAEEASVDAGDGNDQVDDDVSVLVEGGPGDDVLTGTGKLSGGPGVDTLTGKPVPPPSVYDLVHGRSALLMDGGQGEHDTFVGAKGDDTVSYQGRKAPVHIDLGRDTNEDRFVGIRAIIAGDGDDVIVGNDQANTLTAGRGHDRILGGGGDDRLFDADDPSRSDLSGGPGNDELTVIGGGRDRLSCGPGVDLVTNLVSFAHTVSVPRDCERARFEDAFTLRGVPRRRGSYVYARVDQRESRGDVIGLFAGRRPLGHSRLVRRKGSYRITLNRAGRRLARRGRVIDVLTTASRPRGADDAPTAYRFRLR